MKLTMNRRILGIQFAPRFLRVAEFCRSLSPVKGGGDLRLPSDPVEAQRMIAGFVEENRLGGVPAVLGLPAEMVFLSLLRLPEGTRHEREETVRDHLEGLHALSGSDTVSDVVEIPVSGGSPRTVLLGVARRDAVCSRLNPLQESGLRIVAAIPETLAFFQLVQERLGRRSCPLVVVCPVAGSGMEVLLGFGGTLHGIWRFPLNLPNDPASEASLEALRTALELLQESPGSRRSDSPVAVWCGDSPLPEELSLRLERVIGRKPVSLSEWFQEPGDSSAPYWLARALTRSLLRSSGSVRLNLLPLPMRERAFRRARLPYWAAAAFLFALASTTLWLHAARRAGEARRRLEAAEAMVSERDRLLALEAELQSRNALLLREAVPLRYSAISPLLARDVMLAIAQAKHPDDWIIRMADSKSYFASPGIPNASPSQGSAPAPFSFAPHLLIVEGYTPVADLSSVRSLIEKLRVHPRIAAVDLLGDDRVGPDRADESFRFHPGIRRFVMEVRIRES